MGLAVSGCCLDFGEIVVCEKCIDKMLVIYGYV